MRLSDAIAMGRVTVEEMQAADITKCALGMACNAVGLDPKMTGEDYEGVKAVWPWLSTIVTAPNGAPNYAITIIWRLFDGRVMAGRMTLDQLIDWVRSVEPSEPEPQQEVVPELAAVAQPH